MGHSDIAVTLNVYTHGLDFAETKIIADRAYKMFFEGDFSAGDKDEEIIDEVEVMEVIDDGKGV